MSTETSVLSSGSPDMSKHLSARLKLDTQDLVKQHPPIFKVANKRLVHSLACPDGWKNHSGSLEVTQWSAVSVLDKLFEAGMPRANAVAKSGIFSYDPPEDPEGSMDWHVNFADKKLLAHWNSYLFAQDEYQALEHPSLCSLEIYLNKNPKTSESLTYTRDSRNKPTPVLIAGVERKAFINTSPTQTSPLGLYGNQFCASKIDAVRTATTIFTEPRLGKDSRPYYTNIIAMEAVKYGYGRYSKADIVDVLTTAYTAFLAARYESHGKRTIVHTGNWGAGAYGGNVSIMYLLQMAAAELAGVEVVFHVVEEENIELCEEQRSRLAEWLAEGKQKGMTVEEFVERVEKVGFIWNVSNGT